MSPALRDLEQVLLDAESALLEGHLAHGDHPVLTMCAANTIVVIDDTGNRKPSKRRSTGRIDGLVALAMALGAAPTTQVKPIDIEALIG
jgi:phage terminase large subunit-like protein